MADNATRYRSAYAQTHVERLQEAMIIAEKELTSEYGSEAAKIKYYQELIKNEEEYIRKVQDAQLKAIEDTKESRKGGAGDDFATRNLIQAEKAYNDASNASVDSVKLGLEAQKLKQAITQDDPTLVTAASRISESLDTAQLSSNNPSQLESQVGIAVSDPAFQAAMQNADPLHKRVAGAKLSQNLTSRGISKPVADSIVAKSLGMTTEDLDPRLIQADKEARLSEVDKYAAAGNAGKLRQMGDIFLKRATEGEGVPATPVEKDAVERFISDPEYASVKRYVSEHGTIEGYPDPTMIEDYNTVKNIIGKSPKSFSDNDTRYFDETYLLRQKQISDADKRISEAKERMATINQLNPPRIEDIRRRAAEIDRPQRQRGLIESTSTKSFYGDHPAKRLSDSQKIMMSEAARAYKATKDPEYKSKREKDTSSSRKFSDQLWSMYRNNTLDPKDLSKKASELSNGDLQLRNEIISKFLENQISEKMNTQFVRTDEKGAPVSKPAEASKAVESVKTPVTEERLSESSITPYAPVVPTPQEQSPIAGPVSKINPVMSEDDLETIAAKRALLKSPMVREPVVDRLRSGVSKERLALLNYFTSKNRSAESPVYVGDDNFMQPLSERVSPSYDRYGSKVESANNPSMISTGNKPTSVDIGVKPYEPVQPVLSPDEIEAVRTWRALQEELRKK